MSGESTLREKAREAMRAGRLPDRRPERSWAGRGGGALCTICGELVRPDEVEYELEFARGDGHGVENRRVHLQCLVAWERERLTEAP